jgi:hypothetical protein
MTGLSRFLLRIARWIAGPQRCEWVDAMEAEAASASGESTGWAIGCVWASTRDRLRREWRFLVAVPLIGFGPLLLSLVLLFPMTWLWHHGWMPKWLIDHSVLLEMLPFAFLLGRGRPGHAAYVAAAICFAVGRNDPARSRLDCGRRIAACGIWPLFDVVHVQSGGRTDRRFPGLARRRVAGLVHAPAY